MLSTVSRSNQAVAMVVSNRTFEPQRSGLRGNYLYKHLHPHLTQHTGCPWELCLYLLHRVFLLYLHLPSSLVFSQQYILAIGIFRELSGFDQTRRRARASSIHH